MKDPKTTEKEFRYAEEAVKNLQYFYLILIGYAVMLIYLHWLDLRDGSYDWAYWPIFGFTLSLIWFAFVLRPGKIKDKLIKKELRNQNTDKIGSNHNYTTDEYQNAKKSVEEKIGFYLHLIGYLVINGYFIFLNLKSGGQVWAVYPLAGWAIGLAFHGLSVFGIFNNSAWKDRQIRKELEKRRRIRNGK